MKQKLISIQVLRAIGFVLIFLSHLDIVATGPIAVSMFLVISGFCMTYAYLDRPERIPETGFKNMLRFSQGKIKKLYPLHLATLLLVALVVFGDLILHKGSGKEIAEQGAYFAANTLLLQSWIPWRDGYYSFNAVSWYLSTAAFSYFLFPWVFMVFRAGDKKRISRLTGITLALMIAVAAFLGYARDHMGLSKEYVKWAVYICPLFRAGDFIVGLTAGYVFKTFKTKLSKSSATVLEILVLALMTLQVMIYNSGILPANWSLSLFWLPTSVLCIYLFAVNKGVLSGRLSKSRVLIWIGDISGEAFLLHQICIKAAEYAVKQKILVALLAFAATLLAVFAWKLLLCKKSVILKIKRECQSRI